MVGMCLAVVAAWPQTDITGVIVSNEDEAAGRVQPDPSNYYIRLGAEYAPLLPVTWDGVDDAIGMWEVRSSQRVTLEGREYVLAVYEWTGMGAALIVFSNINGRALIAGGYCYLFGGNGADMTVRRVKTAGKALSIDVMCIGRLRAYYIDPERGEAEGNHVMPSDIEETIRLIFRTGNTP